MTQYNAANVPSSVAGTDKGLTYTILSGAMAAQLHPLFRRQVYLTYGSGLINTWSEIYGSNSTIAGMQIIHTEQDRFQFPIVVQNAASGAAGAAVTITITTGSLAGGVKSPVTVGYTVYNSAGSSYKVTAVAAENTMELTPYNPATAVNVAANDNLVFSPVTLVGGGSTMGNSGFRYPPIQFTSYINTLRKDLTLTDEDLYNLNEENTFFDWVDPATGANYQFYDMAAIKEQETLFFNGRELYMINQEANSNTGVIVDGSRGTNGILTQQKAYGTTVNYVGALGLQVTQFKLAAIAMAKNKSSREYLCYGGVEFNIAKDQTLKDYFPNGDIEYGAFSGGMERSGDGRSDKEIAIAMGFKSLSAFGRTWHFVDNPIFSDPSYFGANGWNYIGESLCIPSGDAMTEDGIAKKHIEIIRPKRSKGYRMITTDGTNVFLDSNYPNTNAMRSVFTFIDDCGVEIFGAKHLMYFGRT